MADYNPTKAGKLLSLGVAMAVLITALVFVTTQQRRHISQQRIIAQQITSLLPSSLYNNDPAAQSVELNLVTTNNLTINKAYPYKDGDKTLGAVLHVTTPHGYSGDIELLVALSNSGTLQGVAIAAHKETPGLGDKIEPNRSDWLSQLKSLQYSRETKLAIKKDGGDFDHITGATITPRAVVNAVSDTLNWYATNKGLFE